MVETCPSFHSPSHSSLSHEGGGYPVLAVRLWQLDKMHFQSIERMADGWSEGHRQNKWPRSVLPGNGFSEGETPADLGPSHPGAVTSVWPCLEQVSNFKWQIGKKQKELKGYLWRGLTEFPGPFAWRGRGVPGSEKCPCNTQNDEEARRMECWYF